MINLLFSIIFTHILIVGDSEAAILSKYVGKVASGKEIICHEYKSGSIIQYWQSGFFKEAVNKHSPDTVIIFLGANNIGRTTELDVSNMLEAVKDKQCIWIGPPKIKNRHWKFNQLLKDNVESKSNCRYFDSEKLNLDLPDGYHPTPKSAVKWLKAIWEFKNNKL